MNRAELRYVYTMRRRRLIGLCFLVPFLLMVFALNDWRPKPIWAMFEPKPIWLMFDRNEGAFAAGDPYGEWIYGLCDGEQQQITVLRNGRLAGFEDLDSLRTLRFPNWCGSLPTVDNPDLPAWQAKLSRLQSLTANPASSAEEILDAAREMPVSPLYLKPISDWIDVGYSNAVDFLDAVAKRPMEFHHPDRGIVLARSNDFSRLVSDALDSVARQGATPEKLAAWLKERQLVGSGRNVAKLARLEGLDNNARAVLLEQLESVQGPERRTVYAALAPHLVRDGKYAALLTEQLEFLQPQTRSIEARQLLTQSDASVQFPIALLSASRHMFHGPDDQLDVFMAAANKLRNEPEAPLLLTRHLREISGIQRRLAANHLLSLDDAGETAFALGVLRSFTDIHPMSRPKLMYTVMESEQFHDRRVQEACLLAVRLELSGRDKQELLSAMLRHQALDQELFARIRGEFS